jgi:hypothetical protein
VNYTWDPAAQQYRGPNGRFVSRSDVLDALNKALDKEMAKVKELAQALRMGRTSLMTWRQGMRDAIKNIHLFSASLAKGGWAQLTQADYGRVGQVVRGEYGYLESFAQGIADGKVDLDSWFTERSTMYAEAGWDTYFQIETAARKEAGFKYESNVLSPVENCTGANSCVEETARGRVRIGKLIPIGRRRCLRRCRCHKEYWMTVR